MVKINLLFNIKGNIVKFPLDSPLIQNSLVLKNQLNVPRLDNEIFYYLNYDIEIIYSLIDFLYGKNNNIDGKLDPIINELRIYKGNNFNKIYCIKKKKILNFIKDLNLRGYHDVCKIVEDLYKNFFCYAKPIAFIVCINKKEDIICNINYNFIDEYLNFISYKVSLDDKNNSLYFNDIYLTFDESQTFKENYNKIKIQYKNSCSVNIFLVNKVISYLKELYQDKNTYYYAINKIYDGTFCTAFISDKLVVEKGYVDFYDNCFLTYLKNMMKLST